MVKRVTESDNVSTIMEGIEEIHPLLALNDRIGFASVCAIDVETTAKMALRFIQEAELVSSGTTERKFALKQAELYVKECDKELTKLMAQVSSLSEGCDKMIPILTSLKKEINSLK